MFAIYLYSLQGLPMYRIVKNMAVFLHSKVLVVNFWKDCDTTTCYSIVWLTNDFPDMW